MTKSELLTIRTTPEVVKTLEKLVEMEQRTFTDEARLLLEIGGRERLKEIALDNYRKGIITLEKASEIAGISVWEMAEILALEKIPYNLDLEALKK